MTMTTINPAWTQYNELVNEGGEGYNPHPKFIARQAAPVTKPTVAVAAARMLKGERGNYISAAKLAERLARDEARLSKITDESAKAITQASIDFARAALAA